MCRNAYWKIAGVGKWGQPKKIINNIKHNINMKNTNNIETIGELVKLLRCTIGSKVSVGFDLEGNVVVNDTNGKCYASYSNDFPVADVYKDLLFKMSKDINQCIEKVREQFAKDKEFKVCKGDYKTYNTITYFGNDYGIKFKGVVENHTPYIKIIGITPLPITSK